MKSTKEALASHFGYDVSDLKDYQYQPSRHTKPIYNIGDDYYCCVSGRQKPAQSTERMADEYFYDEIESHVNAFGFKVFKRLTEDEIYARGLA